MSSSLYESASMSLCSSFSSNLWGERPLFAQHSQSSSRSQWDNNEGLCYARSRWKMTREYKHKTTLYNLTPLKPPGIQNHVYLHAELEQGAQNSFQALLLRHQLLSSASHVFAFRKVHACSLGCPLCTKQQPIYQRTLNFLRYRTQKIVINYTRDIVDDPLHAKSIKSIPDKRPLTDYAPYLIADVEVRCGFRHHDKFFLV